MAITSDDWLPIGSVVHLKDGDRLIMVAGHMQAEARTGSYWDYLGYPYPEGRADAKKDYFFNRDFIDDICFVGYQDSVGLEYLDLLDANDEKFREEQKRHAGQAGLLHKDSDSVDSDDDAKDENAARDNGDSPEDKQ
jgi:hypothetical protein